MIPPELDVDWHHDRMRVVLPVWRDRTFARLVVFGTVLLVSVWIGVGVYLLGGLVMLMFVDNRRVVIELDARHLALHHRILFRDRVDRFALHTVSFDVVDGQRLIVTDGQRTFGYRWGGSPHALAWLRDEVHLARARAVDPVALPVPPPELSRLQRVAQGGQSPANTTSGSSTTPV